MTKVYTSKGARVEFTVAPNIDQPAAHRYGAWRFSFDNVIVSIVDEYKTATVKAMQMAAAVGTDSAPLVEFLGRD